MAAGARGSGIGRAAAQCRRGPGRPSSSSSTPARALGSSPERRPARAVAARGAAAAVGAAADSVALGGAAAPLFSGSFFGAVKAMDYLSTAIFAWEGAALSSRRGHAFPGSALIAAVTALGGGTLRDLCLGRPAFWIEDAAYVRISVLAGALAAAACALRRERPDVDRLASGLRVPTAALTAFAFAVFSTIGSISGYVANRTPYLVGLFGVLGSCGGGVIRDVILARGGGGGGGDALPSVLFGEDTSLVASGAGSLGMVLACSYTTMGSAVVVACTLLTVFSLRLHGAGVVRRLNGLPRAGAATLVRGGDVYAAIAARLRRGAG